VTLEIDSRLRIGRALGKDEAVVACELMAQLRERGHPERPPALASDGKGQYREAMLATWGQVPPRTGQPGKPATRPQPLPDWQYRQGIKTRSGGRMVRVKTKVIYGDPGAVPAYLGAHTAYVERTQLTSRQRNARLVRKTLSFSKQGELLAASCAWEDAGYNFVRPHKSLRVASATPGRRWEPRTPMMAAGLTDHPWTLAELLTTLVVHDSINTD
jgi:hypothetical protein